MFKEKLIIERVNGEVPREGLRQAVELVNKVKTESIVLTAEPLRNSLSSKQRRYYFGVVVKELAAYSGQSKDEVHEYLKFRFIKRNGDIVSMPKFGEGEMAIRRLSIQDLNTVEMEDYLSEVRKWASRDLGVFIALPNECDSYFRYQFEND